MNIIWLVLVLSGNPPSVAAIPFESMAACQDAKTVIMATVSEFMPKAYCFPSSR